MQQNNTPGDPKWLSYHLYVGPYFDFMDELIIGPIAQMVRQLELNRWFYIRYTDENGPHIRFRMCVPHSAVDVVDREIRRRATVALDELARLAPTGRVPLVSFDLFRPPDMNGEGWTSVVDVRAIAYEPEYDVYGEAGLGMPIAETFFHGSSELALQILTLDNGALPNTRKTLGPCLANQVLKVFKPEQGREKFLNFYANYWLTGTGMIQTFTDQFNRKIDQLRADRVPIVREAENLEPAERRIMEQWETLLWETERRYRTETGDFDQAQRQKLAFNFFHLMNNRLGLGPLDEAYIANLVARVPPSLEYIP